MNGYNIVDRIKSANKELFEEGDSSVQSGDFTETLRRVSFRPEPDYEPSEPEVDEVSSGDEEDIATINQVLDRRADEEIVFEREVIEVDTEKNEIDNTQQNRMSNGDDNGADDEIEEICEDINNVDLTASDESQTINRNEEAISDLQPPESSSSAEPVNNQHDDVPSPTAETKTISRQSSIGSGNVKNSNNVKAQGSHSKSSSAKMKTNDSLQHHHHHHHHNQHRPNSSGQTKKSTESQFLKIQLNFKPCCEYKYLENDRLPRYCGYISQYGLSKEQLELREKRKERFKERQSDKTAKQLQEETMKSEVNEEAFARWLQNKMRNSRSMTKNMYDYRPTKQTRKGKKKV